jgi:hypothetical protein
MLANEVDATKMPTSIDQFALGPTLPDPASPGTIPGGGQAPPSISQILFILEHPGLPPVRHRGWQLRGIAVHLAARIMALAGPDEVLVSGTTRKLLDGSGIRLDRAQRVSLRPLGTGRFDRSVRRRRPHPRSGPAGSPSMTYAGTRRWFSSSSCSGPRPVPGGHRPAGRCSACRTPEPSRGRAR